MAACQREPMVAPLPELMAAYRREHTEECLPAPTEAYRLVLMAAYRLVPTGDYRPALMADFQPELMAACRAELGAGCLRLEAMVIEATFHRGPIFFARWRPEVFIKLLR